MSLPIVQVHFSCKCDGTCCLLDGCAWMLSYHELPKGIKRLSKFKSKRWGLTLCRKLRSEEVSRTEVEGVVCHCVLADISSPGSVADSELQKILHPREFFLWPPRISYLLMAPYHSSFTCICDPWLSWTSGVSKVTREKTHIPKSLFWVQCLSSSDLLYVCNTHTSRTTKDKRRPAQ